MGKIKKNMDDEEQREHQQQQSSSDEEYLEATGKLLKEHQLQQVATKQVTLPRSKLEREGDVDDNADRAVSAAAFDYNKEPTTISTASTLQMSDTLRSRRRLFSKNCGEGDQTHTPGIAEGGISRVRKMSSRWFSELFGGRGEYSAARAPENKDEDNKDIVTTLECDNSNSNNDILKVDVILWTEVDSSSRRKRRVRGRRLEDEQEDVSKNELTTGAGCVLRATANYLREGEHQQRGSETFEMKNVFPSNYNGNCSVNLALDRDNGDDYYNNRRLYDGPGAVATSRRWGHRHAGDRDRENFEELAKINFSSNTTASTSYSQNGGTLEAVSFHYDQTHCYPDRIHLHHHHRQRRWDCDKDDVEGEEAEAQWNGRTVSHVEAPAQTSTTAGRKYEQKPGSGKRRRRLRHDCDGAAKEADDHHEEKSSRKASVSEYCYDNMSSISSSPDVHEEMVSVALSGRTSQEGSANWRSGRQKRTQNKLKPSASQKNKNSPLDGVDNQQQLGPMHAKWVSDEAGNENYMGQDREEGEEERDVEEEELQYFINHYDTNNNLNNNNNNQRDQDGNFRKDKEVAGLAGGRVGGWFALPLGRSRSRKLKGKDREKNRKFYYSKIAVRE